jgi:hypothetical protein
VARGSGALCFWGFPPIASLGERRDQFEILDQEHQDSGVTTTGESR